MQKQEREAEETVKHLQEELSLSQRASESARPHPPVLDDGDSSSSCASHESSPEKPRSKMSGQKPQFMSLSEALTTIETLESNIAENSGKVEKLEKELAEERRRSSSSRKAPVVLDADDSSSSSQPEETFPDNTIQPELIEHAKPVTLMDEQAQEELARKLEDLGEEEEEDDKEVTIPEAQTKVHICSASKKKKERKFTVHKKQKAMPLVFTPTKDDTMSIQDLAVHGTSQEQTQTKQKKRTHAAVLKNKTPAATASKAETEKRTERSRKRSLSGSRRRSNSSQRKIIWKDEPADSSDFEEKPKPRKKISREEDFDDDCGDDSVFIPEDDDDYDDENTKTRTNRKKRSTSSKKRVKHGKKRLSNGSSPISSKRQATSLIQEV